MTEPASTKLKRQFGLVELVVAGLGSIVSTGAFIGIGIAAGLAGAGMIQNPLFEGGFMGIIGYWVAVPHPLDAPFPLFLLKQLFLLKHQ